MIDGTAARLEMLTSITRLIGGPMRAQANDAAAAERRDRHPGAGDAGRPHLVERGARGAGPTTSAGRG